MESQTFLEEKRLRACPIIQMIRVRVSTVEAMDGHEERAQQISRFCQASESSCQHRSNHSKSTIRSSHTRGSTTAGVCTWTTFCTNLMQHILTPTGAVSHLFNMFDLIAAILFQVGMSLGFAILAGRKNMRHDSLTKAAITASLVPQGLRFHLEAVYELLSRDWDYTHMYRNINP